MTKNILLLLSLVIACLFPIFTSASIINGNIVTNGILTGKLDKHLCPSTRVTLSGVYTAAVTEDGSFSFYNVAPGSYLLEIYNIDYIFPKLRVNVKENEIDGAYVGVGIGWDKTGYAVPHPFVLKAKAEAEYFTPKQGFNVLGMFKNPMFLMLGFSGIMMFIMPKMLQNMDPEAMKELTQPQSDRQNKGNETPSLSQMFAQAQAQAQQRQAGRK
ncbi:unnamed protein product [Cunninghamella blakesleeana]